MREEVKEMLKWNVDRSSPSNKIRELMEWTKDIMKDIAYQRHILSNPIAICLTKGWLELSNSCFIINCLWISYLEILLKKANNYETNLKKIKVHLIFRLIWNHIVTILSFAINILMLVTWQAKASLASPSVKDLMHNTTAIPDIVREWARIVLFFSTIIIFFIVPYAQNFTI